MSTTGIQTGTGFKAAVLVAANLEREDFAQIFRGHSQPWVRDMHLLLQSDFVMFLAKLDPLNTERFWDWINQDESIKIAESFGARAREMLSKEPRA